MNTNQQYLGIDLYCLNYFDFDFKKESSKIDFFLYVLNYNINYFIKNVKMKNEVIQKQIFYYYHNDKLPDELREYIGADYERNFDYHAKNTSYNFEVGDDEYYLSARLNKLLESDDKFKSQCIYFLAIQSLFDKIGFYMNINQFFNKPPKEINFEYYQKSNAKKIYVSLNSKIINSLFSNNITLEQFKFFVAIRSLLTNKQFIKTTYENILYRSFGIAIKGTETYYKTIESDDYINYQKNHYRRVIKVLQQLKEMELINFYSSNKRRGIFIGTCKESHFNNLVADYLNRIDSKPKNNNKAINEILRKKTNKKT